MTRPAVALVRGRRVRCRCAARQRRQPATLDTAHEPCRQCRMVISDSAVCVADRRAVRGAAVLRRPGLPRATISASSPALPRGAVIYVADHRTQAWVRADRAVYTRVDDALGADGLAHRRARVGRVARCRRRCRSRHADGDRATCSRASRCRRGCDDAGHDDRRCGCARARNCGWPCARDGRRPSRSCLPRSRWPWPRRATS